MSEQTKIDKKRIANKNIKLTGSTKNHVLRISKPIIIGDIAIFSTISSNEIPIYIFKRKGNKWKVVYTFCDRLILYDKSISE